MRGNAACFAYLLSLKAVVASDLPGYAIGGVSVGEEYAEVLVKFLDSTR